MEDHDFSALYSSIDNEQYDAYVEIANAPTPYLVPKHSSTLPRQKPKDLFPIKQQSRILPKIPDRPPERPPPSSQSCRTKPHPLPRAASTKMRAGTPANIMADTPFEQGWVNEHSLLPQDKLSLLQPDANIRGKLQTGTGSFTSATSSTANTPAERLTGNKYSALSGDLEVNQYASLKPLRKQKSEKLRERVKRRKNKDLNKGDIQLGEVDGTLPLDMKEDEMARKDSFSDGSRAVCIMLAIIIIALVMAIGSLIAAAYTIVSFEHYKGRAMLHTKAVNECSTTHLNLGMAMTWVKCEYRQTDNNTDDERAELQGERDYTMEQNTSQTDRPYLVNCKAILHTVVYDALTTCTAILMEEPDPNSPETNKTYCLCTCKARNVISTIPMSCIVIETTFGL